MGETLRSDQGTKRTNEFPGVAPGSEASRFSFPTAIHFGVGVVNALACHLMEAGVSRPLLVTDSGLASLDVFGGIVAALRTEGLDVAVFSGVIGNPVVSQVSQGVDAFHAHGADAVVGVGGGAALDVAKVVALMATHPGELLEYAEDAPSPREVVNPLPYLVGVPTTAGTGSEVGRASVISDETTHVKHIIFSPSLLAKAVFADAALTVGLPAGVTAATGMDALTHNVEAYLARSFHPICDGIALEGVRLVSRHLQSAVADGTDLNARSGMLMASMMGAIAFQKGLGVVHSTAHALGAVVDMHHGLANAVMIDHVLPFNAEAVPERFDALATAAGSPEGGADGFVGWLRSLKSSVGIPSDLSAAGVDKGVITSLVDIAVEDGCHLENPRPVTREDFIHLFDRAFG